MSIEGITTSSTDSSVVSDATATTNGVEDLDYDDFLTLLVAQLENQDPLEPLESSEFTAQLAQYATVEQLYGMNESLTEIQETLSSQGAQQDLLDLIGRTVKADDNIILVQDGEVLSGSYSLEDDANVTISIYDEDGQIVRTLYLSSQEQGEYEVIWDGENDDGETMADGSYYFEVSAEDQYGYSVDASTYITGEITGVNYQYGEPYLIINDRLVSPDNSLFEISQTSTSSD